MLSTGLAHCKLSVQGGNDSADVTAITPLPQSPPWSCAGPTLCFPSWEETWQGQGWLAQPGSPTMPSTRAVLLGVLTCPNKFTHH